MTRIKRSFLLRWNSVIAWFLSVWGIACSPITSEYGTPEGKFIVNGTVQSEETNAPIDHIRVIMGNDTAYSDATGKFEVADINFPVSQSYLVNFSDVDGAINGEFTARDTLVEFTDPEFIDGDGDWYQGETKKLVNVTLKPLK
ncbi:MAG: radical SAM-associated putative lipoprotein [Bacteroidota bacterium]